ncbi:MAG TPA: DUF1893 domain-containing protein [Smithellaceae bacterium]|jgi:hypothetical protein|nr:DUF1893 domain-containing protein [Smithellaceae bacterium]
MVIPDFTAYRLALADDSGLIHSSRESGLKPLWQALETFRNRRGLILFDKVIGLAAARLIVHSGIVASVRTLVASRPAKKYLEENGIPLDAADVTEHILTRDRSTVCPGEQIALACGDDETFMKKMQAMLAAS